MLQRTPSIQSVSAVDIRSTRTSSTSGNRGTFDRMLSSLNQDPADRAAKRPPRPEQRDDSVSGESSARDAMERRFERQQERKEELEDAREKKEEENRVGRAGDAQDEKSTESSFGESRGEAGSAGDQETASENKERSEERSVDASEDVDAGSGTSESEHERDAPLDDEEGRRSAGEAESDAPVPAEAETGTDDPNAEETESEEQPQESRRSETGQEVQEVSESSLGREGESSGVESKEGEGTGGTGEPQTVSGSESKSGERPASASVSKPERDDARPEEPNATDRGRETSAGDRRGERVRPETRENGKGAQEQEAQRGSDRIPATESGRAGDVVDPAARAAEAGGAHKPQEQTEATTRSLDATKSALERLRLRRKERQLEAASNERTEAHLTKLEGEEESTSGERSLFSASQTEEASSDKPTGKDIPETGAGRFGDAGPNHSADANSESPLQKNPVQEWIETRGIDNHSRSSMRLDQMPVANFELRRQILPSLTRGVSRVTSGDPTQKGSWQKHQLTLDDGQKLNLMARREGDVLQLKLQSSNPELNRLLVEHQQEIRQHLEKECGIEVDLQLNQGGDSDHPSFDDWIEGGGASPDRLSGSSDEDDSGAETTEVHARIRSFGYNRMEWTG